MSISCSVHIHGELILLGLECMRIMKGNGLVVKRVDSRAGLSGFKSSLCYCLCDFRQITTPGCPAFLVCIIRMIILEPTLHSINE